MCLKLREFKEGVMFAERVLKIYAEDVKALYSRGMPNRNGELERGYQGFQEVLREESGECGCD